MLNPKCPDCKKKQKILIKHHIITKKMLTYLIKISTFEEKELNRLRKNLFVMICKTCEKKFHNGDFEGGKLKKDLLALQEDLNKLGKVD